MSGDVTLRDASTREQQITGVCSWTGYNCIEAAVGTAGAGPLGRVSTMKNHEATHVACCACVKCNSELKSPPKDKEKRQTDGKEREIGRKDAQIERKRGSMRVGQMERETWVSSDVDVIPWNTVDELTTTCDLQPTEHETSQWRHLVHTRSRI